MNTLDRKKMEERADAGHQADGSGSGRKMLISDMPVGHKQFTEIARELSKDHLKLLILDEPTAVLTEKEAEALLSAIRGWRKGGIAVIFITHRLHEILSVCDRVCVMRDGKLVQDVPAKETDIPQITRWMVGREIEGKSEAPKEDTARNSSARTILSISHLWVDMPGETVRDVTLEVKEGRSLGSAAWPDRGSSGSPTGSWGCTRPAGRSCSTEKRSRSIPRENAWTHRLHLYRRTAEASGCCWMSRWSGILRFLRCRSRINS